MFCSCSAYHFAVKPNSQTCPTCLGLPGALPYANKEAIQATVALGLAFGCRVNSFSKFDRKHYFYPDLAKSYQISQYDIPFCVDGIWAKTGSKQVRIRRIHLEEDTGKLIHTEINNRKVSLVDFNRSGVPLVEIVTEPDFRNSDEVSTFLKDVQKIVRYLKISSADMEKGSMRLEANISLTKDMRTESAEINLPDYKVEIKNINSFKFLDKAINSEIARQEELLNNKVVISQETRGFNEATGTTVPQRGKEEAKDYRYFPEPDIPPIKLSKEEIDLLKKSLPELPDIKQSRFIKKYKIPAPYCAILTSTQPLADYYEKAVELGEKEGLSATTIADLIVNKKFNEKYPEPGRLITELREINRAEYSSEEEVDLAVKKILSQEEKAVRDFAQGKSQVIGFLLGKVQGELKAKGDPQVIRRILIAKLKG